MAIDSVTDVGNDVSSNITGAQDISSNAVEQAQGFLDNLESVADGINLPSTSFGFSNYVPDVQPVQYPDKPDRPDVSLENVALPDKPNFTTVNTISENIPDIEATAPTLDNIAVPDIITPAVPNIPVLQAINLPQMDISTLPQVPTIDSITIPPMPSFQTLEFTGTAPVNTLTAPDVGFNYTESEYISALADAVKTKLENDITNGGTGLAPAVEQAIYDRERERNDLALQTAIETAQGIWAARGFDMPDGILMSETDKLIQDYEYQKDTLSRDISVKQAELAQNNTQFSVTTAANYEGILMQHADNVASRALQSARAVADVGIALFNSQVANFNTKLEAYKTDASVFASRIQAQISQAELYRTQIEGAKLQSDIQTQKIDLYRSQLSGVDALINVYKNRLQSVQLEYEAQRNQLDIFKGQIDAYKAGITANASKIDLYRARLSGQETLLNKYKAQIDSHNARLQSVKLDLDAKIENNRGIIEANKNELARYDADYRGYIAEYNKTVEDLRVKAQMYGADAQMYSADGQIAESNARVAESQNDSLRRQSDRQLALFIDKAKANLAAFTEIARIRVTAAKGGADVYASMASAALTAVNTLVTLGSRALTTASSSTV